MAEKIEMQKEKRRLPLGKLIKKNLALMLLITLLCTLLATAYCIAFVKPTYTATSSVILRMTSQTGKLNQAETDVSLAQRYLPTIADIVVSPKIIEDANEIYHKDEKVKKSDKISANAVSIAYGERSLIFTISYTDANSDNAKAKVSALVEAASNHLELGVLSVESISLIPTDNEIAEPKENSGYLKIILVGFAVGVAGAFVVVLLKYALDNTITDKKDFEELTGIDVLALIDKQDK
ncbi:MAG: hypothetical protein IJC07_04900 [Clostridia bacterium]|nr:hypothetical protein [Clostridia bacterium]